MIWFVSVYIEKRVVWRYDVRKICLLLAFLIFGMTAEAGEKPEELYAQSAVLMDAETGRVLFDKNGDDVKAMASTTKIMTCILVLERCQMNEVVTFSENACSKPKVHLGAVEGEQFYIEDLLYSLMLESHNDVAAAIAEAVAGSEEEFAILMNQKAKEIGCEKTYFITPNGLDAEDENGFHSTTAKDLAKILSYCINKSPAKEDFLEITGTPSYTFSNLDQTRQYNCTNYNTYLSMNREAISGKTGYTGKAGYCYVGAVDSEGRTFVVSLLACGWPSNKNYKWKDMDKIIAYAKENYELCTLYHEEVLDDIVVRNGKSEYVSVQVKSDNEEVLLHKEDEIKMELSLPKEIDAPVTKGEQVGNVIYILNGEIIKEYPIICTNTVKRIDFSWIFSKMLNMYLI